MDIQQKSKSGVICLAALVVATLMFTGCLGSAPGPVTATHDNQNEHPAAGTAVPAKTTTVPAPLKTAPPTPAPGLSTAGIAIDSIGDQKTGGQFLLTGTTSLPVGTNLFWQIIPDTGTPPTGLDRNSMMSLGGNTLVTRGDGTTNRIAQAVALGRLVPGKDVVIVGEMKGGFSDFAIGDRYGYAYFTLK